MFATILRRWRIVTPLALAVLAIAVVTSGVLASASAHTVHFHFWGRATALEDNSIVLPDWACDTGPLSSLDGTAINVDTGHCINIFGQNATNGQNEIGNDVVGFGQAGVTAHADFANATVKTDNTKKEGHVISVADLEGLTVTLPGFFAADTTDADGDGNLSPALTLLTAVQLEVTAEAECELAHGHVHASARATTQEVFNDLFVLEGLRFNGGDEDGDNIQPVLAHLTPSGEPNQSFPLFNILTLSGATLALVGLTGPVTEQITVNEQRSFRDGGISWIRTTGVHLIMTNANGTVILNLSLDSVFAAIHCEKHLPNDDAIGA